MRVSSPLVLGCIEHFLVLLRCVVPAQIVVHAAQLHVPEGPLVVPAEPKKPSAVRKPNHKALSCVVYLGLWHAKAACKWCITQHLRVAALVTRWLKQTPGSLSAILNHIPVGLECIVDRPPKCATIRKVERPAGAAVVMRVEGHLQRPRLTINYSFN